MPPAADHGLRAGPSRGRALPAWRWRGCGAAGEPGGPALRQGRSAPRVCQEADRKSTRLNSSHSQISYAVFCLKKKNHTSELQANSNLVCRLLLEKKNTTLLRT